MDLVSLLIALIIVGAVLFVVNRLPIDGTIKCSRSRLRCCGLQRRG